MTTRDVLQEHLNHLHLRGMSPATLEQRKCTLLRLARAVGCDVADLLALTEEDLDGWQHTLVASPRSTARPQPSTSGSSTDGRRPAATSGTTRPAS